MQSSSYARIFSLFNIRSAVCTNTKGRVERQRKSREGSMREPGVPTFSSMQKVYRCCFMWAVNCYISFLLEFIVFLLFIVYFLFYCFSVITFLLFFLSMTPFYIHIQHFFYALGTFLVYTLTFSKDTL